MIVLAKIALKARAPVGPPTKRLDTPWAVMKTRLSFRPKRAFSFQTFGGPDPLNSISKRGKFNSVILLNAFVACIFG